MPLPTEEELEQEAVERLSLHLEKMERLSKLGIACVSELGRMNAMEIIGVGQALVPNKLKMSTDAVSALDRLLKKAYKEANGTDSEIVDGGPGVSN